MKNRKATAMRFFHFFTLVLLLICYLGPVSAEPTPMGSHEATGEWRGGLLLSSARVHWLAWLDQLSHSVLVVT